MALAAAQGRHEKHWLDLLGEHAEPAIRPSLRNQFLGLLAARLGSVFALALAQRSESGRRMPTTSTPPLPWPQTNPFMRK